MHHGLITFEDAGKTAQIALATLNVDECFVSMNSEYSLLLGYEAGELIGRNWRDTVHLDDRTKVEEAYRLARADGQGHVEVRGHCHDSSSVHQTITVTTLSDPSGALSGYECRRQNTSRSKKGQDALMMAVECAPNGFMMLDSAGHIQTVNRSIERLFGYSREELAGCTIEVLLPERFRAHHHRIRNAFATSETNKAVVGRDLVGLRKDGVEIPLQVYLNRVETDAGDLILCTIIDIAERVRYQKQLELAKQEAEAASHAKSDFLARMSHEIRTPMNLIMGMNSLLMEDSLTPKQKRMVEVSQRNVRRLLRLINGILDLSKVEAGKLTLQATPFHIHSVVEDCIATMNSSVESKGLDLTFQIDPQVAPYWIGDSERLQQILLNLVGNAVKFTERGRIELQVHSECDAGGNQGMRFEVLDSGCGVPDDKHRLIFESFQQADGAMNRPYEGTGLGLAIAKTLVEMMSGQIWVESPPAGGAKFVFTVFFPRSSEEAVFRGSLVQIAKKTQVIRPGTRLLIVDDNEENIFLLESYLENLSLEIEVASNGIEAIEKRAHGTFDLILMDIQMPVMDGYTATRQIREWEKTTQTPKVPIVALTAHALAGARTESAEAGCDGHLSKPVAREELLEALATFARRAKAPVKAVADPIAARRPAFLANRLLDLAKMRDALAAGDFQAIQNIGHNCKGIGAGYGFPEVSEVGAALESAAREFNANQVRELLSRFEISIAVPA